MDMLLSRICKAALSAAFLFVTAPYGHSAESFATPELIAKAEAEGNLVLYTGEILEDEMAQINAFKAKFPKIKIDLVRQTSQKLVPIIEAEVATNKLRADIIDLTDWGTAVRLGDLFTEYSPPNSAKYESAGRNLGKLWPRFVFAAVIVYNTALVKDPPKDWPDLLDDKYRGKLALVVAGSGGSSWTRIMYERQKYGLEYWQRQAALQPTLAPASTGVVGAVVRGEAEVGVAFRPTAYSLLRDGAPLETVYPKSGIPLTPTAAGLVKTGKNPNAARLFLNFALSEEGQKILAARGWYSMLPSARPESAKGLKLWLPNDDEYEKLRDEWVREWNRIYGFRG
jgi:iron(III) transport system substrate-binding protein